MRRFFRGVGDCSSVGFGIEWAWGWDGKGRGGKEGRCIRYGSKGEGVLFPIGDERGGRDEVSIWGV